MESVVWMDARVAIRWGLSDSEYKKADKCQTNLTGKHIKDKIDQLVVLFSFEPIFV